MKFTVNVASIQQALQSVVGAAEKRTTIPVLGGVLIRAEGGKLFLSATDLELAISTEIAADVKEEGRVVVPVRKMLDYIKLLDSETVSASVSKELWVSFTAGKSRTRIAGMDAASFPEIAEFDREKSDNRLDPILLKRCIDRGIIATDTKEGRFAFHGVLFSAKDGNGIIVSTDGARMSAQSLPVSGEFRVVVPKRLFVEVSRYLSLESGVGFYIDGNRIFFSVCGLTLSAQRIESPYPDHNKVIPSGLIHDVVFSKAVLYRALERASKFADELSKSVRLHLSPDGSKIVSSSKTGSDCEEDLDVTFESEYTVGFNSFFVMEYLRQCPGDKVTLSFAGSDKPHVVSDGAEGSVYVIVPMRF